jgi:D-alanine--poly(phosphoribitol) ligase subunit 2
MGCGNMENYQMIKSFLEERFFVKFNDQITDETDLFKAGVVESKGYMGIVRFLQDDLKIEMTDEDLFSNVLVSLANIVDFVKRKRPIKSLANDEGI